MTLLSDPRGTMPMRSGIGEADYGTPKSNSDVMVSVTIDGETHLVPEGTSVMRAAGENGCDIPKLCATDSLQPFGSCRMWCAPRQLRWPDFARTLWNSIFPTIHWIV